MGMQVEMSLGARLHHRLKGAIQVLSTGKPLCYFSHASFHLHINTQLSGIGFTPVLWRLSKVILGKCRKTTEAKVDRQTVRKWVDQKSWIKSPQIITPGEHWAPQIDDLTVRKYWRVDFFSFSKRKKLFLCTSTSAHPTVPKTEKLQNQTFGATVLIHEYHKAWIYLFIYSPLDCSVCSTVELIPAPRRSSWK